MPFENLTQRPGRKHIWAGFLLTLWFLSSSLAIILTKALFSGWYSRLRPFPFGLAVTATNNVVAGVLASLIFGPTRGTHQDPNVKRVAVVIGAATAAEIGLSNIALNLLSVSFSTVLKGMAPFFVMGWAAMLGLQRLRVSLVVTMLAIAVGLTLAVAGEGKSRKASLSSLIWAGFGAQLISAVLSGFRWILTQVFVKGERICNDWLLNKLNIRPLSKGLSATDTIRMTAPYTLGWVLPFVIGVEGRGMVEWFTKCSLMECVNLLTVLVIIGVCVYGLLWAEYELVRVTSAVTVAVGFVMKEVLVIFAGAVVFADKLSGLTCIGFGIVQCGVFAYSLIRVEPVVGGGGGRLQL